MRIAVVEHQTVRPFELVRQAVAAGHEVVFVTCDLNLYLKGLPVSATDLRLAERVLTPSDTTDPDHLERALAPVIRELGLDAVITMSEQHTLAVAETAARLGLPHTSPTAVRLTRDKFRTRERLAAAGIPQPRFRLASSVAEAVAASAEIGYPVVVKPVDGSASINVTVAEDDAAVTACAEQIIALGSYGRSATAARLVLVEEFMVGPMVSCETMTADGRHLVLGLTDRELTPLPDQVELGGCFPAVLAQGDQAAAMCQAALDAIGFDLGAAHTEMVLTPHGPRIVEINGRLAGGLMPFVFGAALARPIYVDVIDLFTRQLLPVLEPTGAVAGIRSLVVDRSGRLAAIEPSPHRDAEGVVDYDIRRSVGDAVRKPRSNRDRCGSVITLAPTADRARALAAKVAASTVLTVERERVVLIDRAGYRRYHDSNGRPLLDPALYDVTLVTGRDQLDQVVPDEVGAALGTDVEDPELLAEAVLGEAAARPFDRILAISERLLLPAAALRDRLGLPGPSEQQMRLFRDKVRMKDYLRSRGIAVPDFAEVTRQSEVRDMLRRHGAVVVKPVLAMGAQDVHIVRDDAELSESWFSDGQRHMVEEFVDGDLFHVDGLVERGVVVLATVSRYLTQPGAFATREPVCGVQLGPDPTRDLLLEFNSRILAEFDWFSGVIHNEVFLTADGRPVVCEIAARPGGGGIIPAFQHLYDVDLYGASLRGQLGEPLTMPPARVHPQCGLTAWAVVYAEPGVLRQVDLPDDDWVVRAHTRHHPGDTVGTPVMAGDGTVLLTVCGPDPVTLTARLHQAIAATKIVTDPVTEGARLP